MTRAEARAYKRQNILMDMAKRGLNLNQYAAVYNSGKIGKQDGIDRLSAATLYRWHKNYREGGVDSLAPRYNTPTGAGSRSLSTQEKELLQAYYLDENRPTVAQTLRQIERYHNLSIDYATARRYLNQLPLALRIKKREGAKAFNDKAAAFVKRSYDMDIMQIISADHHILDLLCRHPHKGTPFRPWLTMITDYRSRKPLGWQICVTPNRYTILAALEQCVENYGVPSEIHIDNGKDFKSKLLNGETITIKNQDPFEEAQSIELQGVFGRLGTTVHFATAYRGQAKPVERFFRFVTETFSKQFPSYTGSNTSDRPKDVALYYGRINGQEKRGDLLELEDVDALMNLWVKRYSAEHHHTGEGMNGRTPDQVFAEESVIPRPVMPPEMRNLVFSEQHKRTVRRTGIHIAGKDYYAPEVVRYLGQEIIARLPFREPGTVIVFDMKGQRLFTAYEGYMDDTGDARENSRLRISVGKKQRAILSQYMEAPARRYSIIDELSEARKAVGSDDVVSLDSYRIKHSKSKKSEGISDFFKGV